MLSRQDVSAISDRVSCEAAAKRYDMAAIAGSPAWGVDGHPAWPAVVEFGRFRVLRHRREVFADGTLLTLGSRAFDILIALMETNGGLVTKDELLSRVWRGTIVDENTLHFQVSALRKALGTDRDVIKTISGRGYRFTADIIVPNALDQNPCHPGTASTAQVMGLSVPTNLPAPISDLIGREDELAEIVDLVMAHRLVTLIGPGGIGKTGLCLEATWRVLPKFGDNVRFVELAGLSDPERVPAAVAAALGLEIATGTVSLDQVAEALGAGPLLLVLETCEHVVTIAARMAEAILRANAAAHVIATSREPLRAEGEWIYVVPPLDLPSDASTDNCDAPQCGSVRLFIERVRAIRRGYSPSKQAVTAIAAICRRLDGIPLAIELAAQRAAVLGTDETTAQLDDRFGLLTEGRRTAPPRHQTLRATLDWSHELLTDTERVVMRRLSIFPGSFTIENAFTAAADAEIAGTTVTHCLANLVSKCLVIIDADTSYMQYRLLDTTRAYALEKLTESGELKVVEQRISGFRRDRFDFNRAKQPA